MTYSFEADYGYSDKFDIQDVNAIDKQTIEVYFTNIPDAISASDESMYVSKDVVRTRLPLYAHYMILPYIHTR